MFYNIGMGEPLKRQNLEKGRATGDGVQKSPAGDLDRLLWQLFDEILMYERTDSSISAPTAECWFEPVPWTGSSRDLCTFSTLRSHCHIHTLRVFHTRSVSTDALTFAKRSWGTVAVMVRWVTLDRGYGPLWEAIEDTWPTQYRQWRRTPGVIDG
jgi:hypothetical protein